ncbi:MAG: DUF2441 domain-containing protein [Bacillota bacterium]
MHIKDQEFFHIHRIGEWSTRWNVNSIIYWGQKEINNFNRFYDMNGLITNLTNGNGNMYGRSALQNFLLQPQSFQEVNYNNMLKIALQIVKEQSIYIRETIFEEVRMNYFPQLPSRKTCIWVCEKESIPYWWNIIGGQKKIFKLQLTGVLHKADQKYLINDTLPHNEIRAHAFNYWTGADGSNSIEEELLFEGIIKIIDEYQDINNFNVRMK